MANARTKPTSSQRAGDIPVKIIALDPSLRATGYAIFEADTLIDCGYIPTKPVSTRLISFADTARLIQIGERIQELIQTYQCTHLVFEIPVGCRNARAAAALYQVKGLVVGIGVACGLTLEPVMPREMKRNLTRDLNADKEIVFKKVCESYPDFATLSKNWSNEKRYAASDAIAIYLSPLIE